MRNWKRLGVGVAAAGLLFILFTPDCTSQQPAKSPAVNPANAAPSIDVERRKLEKIRPGTVIGQKAPEGWSDLVHFAGASLTDEDLQAAPKTAAFYAQLFRYVLLAKVEKGADGFFLKSVAAGFAVTIKGNDTVIDSKNRFGADLRTFGGRILEETEKAWEKDVRQSVRTPSLLVIDDRQLFLRDKKHVPMLLRYAIQAEPQTGRVRTLVWLVSESEAGNTLAEPEMQLLPAAFREKYILSVLREKFGLLGIPDDDAFARRKIPQGTPVAIIPELAKLAALKTFTADDARQLEKSLRTAADKP